MASASVANPAVTGIKAASLSRIGNIMEPSSPAGYNMVMLMGIGAGCSGAERSHIIMLVIGAVFNLITCSLRGKTLSRHPSCYGIVGYRDTAVVKDPQASDTSSRNRIAALEISSNNILSKLCFIPHPVHSTKASPQLSKTHLSPSIISLSASTALADPGAFSQNRHRVTNPVRVQRVVAAHLNPRPRHPPQLLRPGLERHPIQPIPRHRPPEYAQQARDERRRGRGVCVPKMFRDEVQRATAVAGHGAPEHDAVETATRRELRNSGRELPPARGADEDELLRGRVEGTDVGEGVQRVGYARRGREARHQPVSNGVHRHARGFVDDPPAGKFLAIRLAHV
ncbi:hypothetical protein CSUB01_04425 [Colletotrichum sublineola]|uniref:Uncharacterized protein n=1 Tax=Colletotrichum sublineola TaxID=1173701 RepID=A0A066X237_COLSU|nr:hypothetical protein CSUB01_04425 [Colletotrichum sublineola]